MLILKHIYIAVLTVFVGILFLGCAPSGLDFDSSEHVAAVGVDTQSATEEKLEDNHFVADTNPLSEPEDVSPDDTYLFGEGDTLKITVFREEDLSGEYKIDNAGFISMPLIGKIKVADIGADQAVKSIEEKLAMGYLRNPDVMVEVKSYRPFSILGEVGAPGNYEYMDGFSVADAVARAGGFTYRANQKEVELLRRHQNGWDTMEVRVGDSVLPGDIIYVRERMF